MCGGNGCTDRLLGLDTVGAEGSASRPARFTPQETPLVTTEYKAGFASEHV